MRKTRSEFPADSTKSERRKNLTPREIKELELAGGVEGGMQAGSAGGPGERESVRKESSGAPPATDSDEG